ncbi:MAG: cytochrome-c peroxidase, partial [Pyrinomonadaceae bacterium]|nr:cytochrome-c peroxidase [Sphingobacteriaceae bacterium]
MFRFLSTCFFVLSIFNFSCKPNKEPQANSELIQKYYLQKVSAADSATKALATGIEKDYSVDKLQNLFLKARLAYKQTEFIAEYYSALTAKAINGAPIREIEVDDQHRIIEPSGFQVIEPLLFPAFQLKDKNGLLMEVNKISSNFSRLKYIGENNPFTEEHMFDALKLEIFRIATLGISGFDAPIAQNSLEEASVSLASLSEFLAIYKDQLEEKDKDLYLKTQSLFSKSIKYLSSNTDFNSFNRMAFITDYANPLSASILKCSKALGLKKMEDLRGLKSDASTLFEK